MNFTCLFFGTVFSVFGAVFAMGKGAVFMWVCNNMTKEERERIKFMPLCRNVGTAVIICGAVFLLKGFWAGFENQWFTFAVILWLAAAVADLLYIEKSGRYKIKDQK